MLYVWFQNQKLKFIYQIFTLVKNIEKKSITSEAVNGLICGFGANSYILAIEAINDLIYK